jgi:hypothetical protein
MKKVKINNKSTIDQNGFMLVENNPILKTGTMDYYGYELGEVDGVETEANKVYSVLITDEVLNRAKDTFKLIPIVDNHKWLGNDGANARDYQEGTTGENIELKEGKLYTTLKFTNPETISKIKKGEKVELSTSYTFDLSKADEKEGADFIASNIIANHLALVKEGRAGHDIRVYNVNTVKNTITSPNPKQEEVIVNRFFTPSQVRELMRLLTLWRSRRRNGGVCNGGPGSGIKGHRTAKKYEHYIKKTKTFWKDAHGKIPATTKEKIVKFRKIRGEEAKKLKAAIGLDLQGFKHSLSNKGLRHIYQRHSEKNETEKDQRGITERDILLIPKITEKYDKVKLEKGKNVLDGIKYIRGKRNYIEVIKKARKMLEGKTMYIKK